ncbi:ATP synthase F1 subunit gamma [Candidatus Roizmanbacteria bacterium RIFCSPHIGHO2_02_FULL_37_15]|uniref:ATP synthase gamma chain n=1 Tax=Candidatus Roizmanbacteria bacterium RIFCSPLOWO2_01_FULL_37_16 TaxID=1802058 RepID=A0A1F7IKK9_9BACT|nr:MAG: ATP synthase F1 subunit gamma [Candidatus Roizmanbacteria bacterium RIFCSPHIGHO2_01_FULL_37_16b]OGK20474.1 MAG: ATP synthase F1 subunit gamma [Candidatus Roizmanbacteria bacterium RIFCSPHIGHO2_02_FULL_37_15]OGK31741.1 MAG: ATP synthase F1 subunit gamma [Candidatus Roizmanbacteria bacterium RIFCSPHIGHO2_12_FULL_36_11]OGK43901.1 MAG: ATP synthase F1 subunit gamma [Candidatus Roizmanbacteria bacterium RIFCSPLOWO2_01_FULL_37_16]OGK55827.1 MAG: ATP synthase F1 subunit gamma [Candidatus Roizm
MNLRQVRKKIKSISNVKKITKAMQLVSAVKMRKAQQFEIDGRPYRSTLERIIEKILPTVNKKLSRLMQQSQGKSDKKLVILISSNKGLSGAFLINLYRFMQQSKIDFSKTDFVTVGSKGAQLVSRIGAKVLADYSKAKFLSQVSSLFSFVLERFLKEEYYTISIIYNRYISAFRSEPVEDILLPFEWREEEEEEEKFQIFEYTIEPSVQELIEPLLKNFLEEKIRGAIISSEAVEHAQRMMAMKNATDNASDIIYDLTLLGNKLRQEKITNELLDMITAKESVEAS